MFILKAVVGDRIYNVPVEKRAVGDWFWYEVNISELYPDIAPKTSIGKLSGQWVLTGPRTELSIDDIQAIGEAIDNIK